MYTLPDLTYDYSALEPFIDEDTMRLHHLKHHQAYVDNLNKALNKYQDLSNRKIEDLLLDLEKIPNNIRTAVRNHGGGHANHSLFWQIMKPKTGEEPQGKLIDAINSEFKSFESFKEMFSKAAVSHFGSGWAWLVNDRGKLSILTTSNQDSPFSKGQIPLLLVDVWEHAYYLKYQNRRVEYIDAWWQVVNWKKVEDLFQKSNK